MCKQPPRRPRIDVAILEGVGLRDLLENAKCQAGGQILFKCFKMQITTRFKFSLPPLVKTKVEAGLPKSRRADSLFFWGLAQVQQLRKGMELMAPSQIDRASWAVGRADSVAIRSGSPKPRQGGGVVGQGDPDGREAFWEPGASPQGPKKSQRKSCMSGRLSLHLWSAGKGEGQTETRIWMRRRESPLYQLGHTF